MLFVFVFVFAVISAARNEVTQHTRLAQARLLDTAGGGNQREKRFSHLIYCFCWISALILFPVARGRGKVTAIDWAADSEKLVTVKQDGQIMVLSVLCVHRVH